VGDVTNWKQLQEGQFGIQEQLFEISTNVRTQKSVQEERHTHNVKRLDDLEHILDGNGQPGLVKTVIEIKTAMRVLVWVLTAIVVPLLICTVTVLVDHFSRH